MDDELGMFERSARVEDEVEPLETMHAPSMGKPLDGTAGGGSTLRPHRPPSERQHSDDWLVLLPAHFFRLGDSLRIPKARAATSTATIVIRKNHPSAVSLAVKMRPHHVTMRLPAPPASPSPAFPGIMAPAPPAPPNAPHGSVLPVAGRPPISPRPRNSKRGAAPAVPSSGHLALAAYGAACGVCAMLTPDVLHGQMAPGLGANSVVVGALVLVASLAETWILVHHPRRAG